MTQPQPPLARFVALLTLCALPALASPAEDALSSAEEHCIMPGGSANWFLTPPAGWTKVETAQLLELFTIAVSPIGVFYGTEWLEPGADPSTVQSRVDESRTDKINDLIEDHNGGALIAMTHDASGATLLVEMESDGHWPHTECTFWPAPADTALARLSEERWTLPLPSVWETPFGTERSLDLTIERNGLPARVYVQVYDLPASEGPVPIVLVFGLGVP